MSVGPQGRKRRRTGGAERREQKLTATKDCKRSPTICEASALPSGATSFSRRPAAPAVPRLRRSLSSAHPSAPSRPQLRPALSSARPSALPVPLRLRSRYLPRLLPLRLVTATLLSLRTDRHGGGHHSLLLRLLLRLAAPGLGAAEAVAIPHSQRQQFPSQHRQIRGGDRGVFLRAPSFSSSSSSSSCCSCCSRSSIPSRCGGQRAPRSVGEKGAKRLRGQRARLPSGFPQQISSACTKSVVFALGFQTWKAKEKKLHGHRKGRCLSEQGYAPSQAQGKTARQGQMAPAPDFILGPEGAFCSGRTVESRHFWQRHKGLKKQRSRFCTTLTEELICVS
ncbi:uncharacterized protein LOC116786267 [Chiroxiphia lanceolata]|uniref:uncharacterized protein LOC116786267 n=1 Tax=Chiroxiphia lanceolata TaxID=296741 RepID=UPI0013CE8B9B|nr:uncharacterized protein LOC116786267 [Chiroxiphia lanceolata]